MYLLFGVFCSIVQNTLWLVETQIRLRIYFPHNLRKIVTYYRYVHRKTHVAFPAKCASPLPSFKPKLGYTIVLDCF